MNAFRPVDLIRVLVEHDVAFVLIGGVAANLLGSTTITRDLDIVYSRERTNLDRLAKALASLKAYPRGQERSLRYRLDAQALRNGASFTLATRLGDLDCLAEASGGFTYERIAGAADTLEVEGLQVRVVSLDDLIRMKRAAGRNKDLIEVENLSALREVRDGKKRR